MFRVWLGQVSENSRKVEEKSLPMTQSTHIAMKTPKGINNKGQTVWWEEVELCEVSKGRNTYPCPHPQLGEN